MRFIELSQGKFALVDDEDFEWLSQWKWCYDTRYARRSQWNKETKKYEVILMHRLLLNPPYKMQVDHINGNGLDNQKINIRICTVSQNGQNKKFVSTNTSGYRGVFLVNPRKNWKPIKPIWRAQIAMKGKSIHLGYFNSKKEAAKAYDKMALKIYGEFAKINFSIQN